MREFREVKVSRDEFSLLWDDNFKVLMAFAQRTPACFYHILDPEDVLQEARIKAWLKFGSWHRRCSFRTWMKTIINRAAIDKSNYGDARHANMSLDALVTSSETEADIASRSSDPQLDPYNVILTVETRLDLMRDLRCLPHDTAITLILHYEEGYEYGEIARALGYHRGTLRRRVHEVRRSLRERSEAGVTK